MKYTSTSQDAFFELKYQLSLTVLFPPKRGVKFQIHLVPV